jgi:L-alanine-DL-glutamate epimerase-like enolase superfamily enzyme
LATGTRALLSGAKMFYPWAVELIITSSLAKEGKTISRLTRKLRRCLMAAACLGRSAVNMTLWIVSAGEKWSQLLVLLSRASRDAVRTLKPDSKFLFSDAVCGKSRSASS